MTNRQEDSPKSILFISGLDIWSMGANKGGPALSQTLLGYANAGWRVGFITGNKGTSEHTLNGVSTFRFDAPNLKRSYLNPRLPFVLRSFLYVMWWLYFQVKTFVMAQSLNKKYSFDVIYSYEILGVFIGKILSLLWRVPFVTRFQGTVFDVRWREGWFKYIYAWDHWLSLRTPADLVIMTDDGTQGDKVLAKLRVDMTKVRFWMNGTDKEAFADLTSAQEAKNRLGIAHRHVLLTVSRLVGWKKVDRAIIALPSVLKEVHDTLLIIVGEGDEKENLMKLCEALGVKDHVLFTGSVPHHEVKYYMAAAAVFLSLYTWSNVGNPLLEAMLAGKCIITIANGDTPRVINNGVTGILLEEDNLAPLPDLIIDLLNNSNRVDELGNNARQYGLENFKTWEKRMEEEISEIASLINLRYSAD